jgi:hypothetical protein
MEERIRILNPEKEELMDYAYLREFELTNILV